MRTQLLKDSLLIELAKNLLRAGASFVNSIINFYSYKLRQQVFLDTASGNLMLLASQMIPSNAGFECYSVIFPLVTYLLITVGNILSR